MTNEKIQEQVEEFNRRYFDKNTPSGVNTYFKTQLEMNKDIRAWLAQALATAREAGIKEGAEKGKRYMFDYVHEKMDFDGEMHRQGKCSFPTASICSAEEHKIKNILYEALNPKQI